MKRTNWALTLWVLLSTCTAAFAQSEVNPEIANCREIRDPATQTQAELCASWGPCKFVLGIHKVCAKARSFLDGLKNFSWSADRKPDMNELFDAAAPLPKGDGDLQRISRTIKDKYAATPGKQLQSGQFESGAQWIYEGGIENGRRHGTGVMVSDGGSLFRGEFVNGRQVGLGEVVDETSRRAGVMQGARLDGPGVEAFSSGNRYEGEFREGLRSGSGTVYWSNGTRFEGVFKAGIIDSGNGTWYYGGGRTYTGPFRDGKFEGRGVLVDGKGWTYAGDFKAGKKEGQGVWTHTGGTRWTGEFRNDLAWNVSIVEPDGRSYNMTNGKAVITTTTYSQPSSSDDVDWSAISKGLLGAANAYAAARTGSGYVAPPPAALPPVQYKPYGTPAAAPPRQVAQDANRFYPLLGCVANSREGPASYANGICAKNNCGRSVTMIWERGINGVAAGGCYPSLSDFGPLLGACEQGDVFDKGRRMCKR